MSGLMSVIFAHCLDTTCTVRQPPYSPWLGQTCLVFISQHRVITMRAALFSLALLPLSRALPQSPPGSSPPWDLQPRADGDYVPAGAQLITDPVELEQLNARHDKVLQGMKSGKAIAVEKLAQDPSLELDKRLIPIMGIGGLFVLVERFTSILGNVLDLLFEKPEAPWVDKGNCRINFRTKAGGNERFRFWNKDEDDPHAEEQVK